MLASRRIGGLKRIILFLAVILVAGSVGVALRWPSNQGLFPRANLAAQATASPSVAPRPASDRYRLPVQPTSTPHATIAPEPTPSVTSSPRPAPQPSFTPWPTTTPSPLPTPFRGCGGCGTWTGPGPRPMIMCPMHTTVYCIDGGTTQ
jgi:hypothetical protein